MQGATELACFNALHRKLKLYVKYHLSEPLCIILLVATADYQYVNQPVTLWHSLSKLHLTIQNAYVDL